MIKKKNNLLNIKKTVTNVKLLAGITSYIDMFCNMEELITKTAQLKLDGVWRKMFVYVVLKLVVG